MLSPEAIDGFRSTHTQNLPIKVWRCFFFLTLQYGHHIRTLFYLDQRFLNTSVRQNHLESLLMHRLSDAQRIVCRVANFVGPSAGKLCSALDIKLIVSPIIFRHLSTILANLQSPDLKIIFLPWTLWEFSRFFSWFYLSSQTYSSQPPPLVAH